LQGLGALQQEPGSNPGLGAYIFVVMVNGVVYALKQDNGQILWKTEMQDGNFMVVRPVVAEFKRYVAGEKYVHCVAVDTGSIFWSYLHLGTRNPLMMADGKVFLIDSVSLTAIAESPAIPEHTTCVLTLAALVLVTVIAVPYRKM